MAACVMGVTGFICAWHFTHYAVSVRLMRNEPPAFFSASEDGKAWMNREPAMATLVDVMRSPDLMRQALTVAHSSLGLDPFSRRSRVEGMPGTDLIHVRVESPSAVEAVELVNAYGGEAVRLTQTLQARVVQDIEEMLREKLQALEADLTSANQALIRFQGEAGGVDYEKETPAHLREWADLVQRQEDLQARIKALDQQVARAVKEAPRHSPALESARAALAQALLRYTEEHPKVKELRATIASLEVQTGTDASPATVQTYTGGSIPQADDLSRQRDDLQRQQEQAAQAMARIQLTISHLPARQLEYARIKSRYQALARLREQLAQRIEEIHLFAGRTAGYYRLVAPARIEDLSRSGKLTAGLLWGGLGGFAGLLGAAILIALLEMADSRIRTPHDLCRVTRLPILASLGDLSSMTEAEKEGWAFRTLAVLKGRLQKDSREALVCGFISSNHGEGRSTWIHLLAGAARKQGYRVMVIASTPPPCLADAPPLQALDSVPDASSLALETVPAALLTPAVQSVMNASLPGVAWSLEGREQWQNALEQLNHMENVVVFAELPPASMSESYLLSEKIPHLIWLCGRDQAQAGETRSQLETLRLSRGRLAGAVFNRASQTGWRRSFGFMKAAAALFCALWTFVACAQDAVLPSGNFNREKENMAPAAQDPVGGVSTNGGTLSVNKPDQLADWQKRLTLGPGDVLNIYLYDQPETAKTGLFIGPDGRLSYLQAQDVDAAGLTVDELRTKLEQTLSRFYRSPRVVVIPSAFNSKKYYLLGNVMQKGVFPLDRPVTIVEAIAKARGFVVISQMRSSLLQADLAHSFLVRREGTNGFTRMTVDFESLFLRGDLAQNLALAPDDYLYFPPLDLPEIYVMGEVLQPGTSPYTEDMTALKAVITRGGFTEKAWRKKLLVVRGSLSHPQTFIVDAGAVLDARSKDFPLKSRDIVYVSRKPWSKAEDLLNAAITDFARSAIITWTGQNVGPWITEPIF